MHLLLPFLAGILLVSGLLCMKRCSRVGITSWTTTFFTCQLSALLFSTLWFFGDGEIQWDRIYQPALIALLFLMGLGFTYLAISVGDVSIATPVLGIKVIFVALLMTWVYGTQLPTALWVAALFAACGIGLIQWTGGRHHHRVGRTVALAVAASLSFATFDLLVQNWSPQWGAARLLPVVYWIVGLAAFFWSGKVQWKRLAERDVWKPLFSGSLLVALQAVCIVLALALFGDAVRVNIVYALRGVWGVLLAWLVAHLWGSPSDGEANRNRMLTRLAGAGLLTAAVIQAILTR